MSNKSVNVDNKMTIYYRSPGDFRVTYSGSDLLKVWGLPYKPKLEEIEVVQSVRSKEITRYTEFEFPEENKSPQGFVLRVVGADFKPGDEFMMNVYWGEMDRSFMNAGSWKNDIAKATRKTKTTRKSKTTKKPKRDRNRRSVRVAKILEREKEKLVERLTALGRRKLKP